MLQSEVDILFSISLVIHEESWFGKRTEPRDREEVQEWIAKQLALMKIYTAPCGASWGVLCSEEQYKEYYTKNGKLNEVI
jgi:hypothetical protein